MMLEHEDLWTSSIADEIRRARSKAAFVLAVGTVVEEALLVESLVKLTDAARLMEKAYGVYRATTPATQPPAS